MHHWPAAPRLDRRARLVELVLGALGPGPQIGPGLLQYRGVRLSGGLNAGKLCRVLALAAL